MSNTTVSPSRRGDNARTLNMVRRIGYRILPGETFSYILHLRPSEWPIMAAHTMLGFLLAAGLDPLAAGSSWREAAFGLFVWVVLLNGGTLALNSAFDNDEGDIGYLIAPPPPPRGLAAYSIALMAIGQALAPLLGLGFTLAYAACFVLSILYSLPPFRWKAVAGADWFINMWGFGTLTPLAGWTITGKPLEPWAILVLLAFCPLFAAFYPLTQLYQFEEDARRGDRTLAIALGMRRSLVVAIAATCLAFLIFAAAAVVGPANALWPTLAIAFAAWLAVLIPWLRHCDTMSPAAHQKGMYRALHAWAITDIAVLLTFIP